MEKNCFQHGSVTVGILWRDMQRDLETKFTEKKKTQTFKDLQYVVVRGSLKDVCNSDTVVKKLYSNPNSHL